MELLLDLVQEQGIVDIITDYKESMENGVLEELMEYLHESGSSIQHINNFSGKSYSLKNYDKDICYIMKSQAEMNNKLRYLLKGYDRISYYKSHYNRVRIIRYKNGSYNMYSVFI